MLILSRKQGEAILVDGGIRIVVLATDNGGVRLGIEAPRDVGIVREEIVDRIADENRRAGATPLDSAWVAQLGGAPAASGEPRPPGDPALPSEEATGESPRPGGDGEDPAATP
jgi:carbon storage regulator